jgi:hypothetical protein
MVLGGVTPFFATRENNVITLRIKQMDLTRGAFKKYQMHYQ